MQQALEVDSDIRERRENLLNGIKKEDEKSPLLDFYVYGYLQDYIVVFSDRDDVFSNKVQDYYVDKILDKFPEKTMRKKDFEDWLKNNTYKIKK